MLTKCMEEIQDGNYISMLHPVLNKFWKQNPAKIAAGGHLPPISNHPNKTWGHWWRTMEELISNVLLWTHTYGYTSDDQPARMNLYQLYADAGCSLDDLPRAMDDRKREKVSQGNLCYQCDMIIYIYIYIYTHTHISSDRVNTNVWMHHVDALCRYWM